MTANQHFLIALDVFDLAGVSPNTFFAHCLCFERVKPLTKQSKGDQKLGNWIVYSA